MTNGVSERSAEIVRDVLLQETVQSAIEEVVAVEVRFCLNRLRASVKDRNIVESAAEEARMTVLEQFVSTLRKYSAKPPRIE